MTALSLDITLDEPSRITIAVSGELDMETARQFDAWLGGHTDKDVTVDLEGVGFLDSSGLSSLIRGYKLVHAAGHTFRTIREPDHVRTVMDIAGVTDIFHDGPVEP